MQTLPETAIETTTTTDDAGTPLPVYRLRLVEADVEFLKKYALEAGVKAGHPIFWSTLAREAVTQLARGYKAAA